MKLKKQELYLINKFYTIFNKEPTTHILAVTFSHKNFLKSPGGFEKWTFLKCPKSKSQKKF